MFCPIYPVQKKSSKQSGFEKEASGSVYTIWSDTSAICNQKHSIFNSATSTPNQNHIQVLIKAARITNVNTFQVPPLLLVSLSDKCNLKVLPKVQLRSASKYVNTVSLEPRTVSAKTREWKSLWENRRSQAHRISITMQGGIGACAPSEDKVQNYSNFERPTTANLLTSNTKVASGVVVWSS